MAYKLKIRRRWIMPLCLVLGILAIVAAAVHIVASPVEGHTTNTQAKLIKAHATTPAQVAPAQLQSAYFTLQLPAGYREQTAAATPSGLLYNQPVIKPSAFGSLVINISVKNLPEGGVAGDSGYSFRAQQPSRYKLTAQTAQGDSLQLANDSQAASVVAFWPHGNYLATISVVSGVDDPASGNNEEELKALQPIVQAWQWQ